MEFDPKYKINLVGEYNEMIDSCDDMDCDWSAWDVSGPEELYNHVLGWAEQCPLGHVMIWECPKCFKKWYCHFGDWETFEKAVEKGTNIHWKGK